MTSRIPRRQFLKGTVAAGLTTAALPRIGHSHRLLNGKLQHASIGAGGMGQGDCNQIAAHPEVELVAICDVDQNRSAWAKETFPEARIYQDWRELFEKEGDRIDSVNITVPDHMHASMTMEALRRQKHIYCQKPLTHDIFEARQVTRLAAKTDVVTQMGVQFTSSIGDRTTVRWIQDGAIGKVEKVFLWSNKDPWKYRPAGPRPTEESPIPESLDWNGWIGTAPMRPFVPEVYHATFWRGWQDFGVGWLGDMGCHITDATYRALELGAPLSVRAEVEPEWRDTPGRFTETWPTWQVVHYVYPGNERTVGKTIEVVWSDGFRWPPEEYAKQLETETGEFPPQGALVVGEEGLLLHPHLGEPSLLPSAKYRDYPRPELEERNHYHHWVDAILGKTKTECGFEHAGPLTEAILLGSLSTLYPDKKLEWDAKAVKVTNHLEANARVRRNYRDGWEVEGL